MSFLNREIIVQNDKMCERLKKKLYLFPDEQICSI